MSSPSPREGHPRMKHFLTWDLVILFPAQINNVTPIPLNTLLLVNHLYSRLPTPDALGRQRVLSTCVVQPGFL